MKLKKDNTRTVYLHNSKDVETMLRKFKKKIMQSGIIDEYKERKYYVKPSVKKRLKNKEAEYRAKNAKK